MARLEIEIAGSAGKLESTVKDSLGLLARLQKSADGLKVELFKANTVQDINRIGGALTSVTGQMKTYVNEATKGSQAFQDQKAGTIIDNLNAKLLSITGNTQLFGASLKNSKAEIGAYQSALDQLLKAGVNPLDARIKNLSATIKSLNAGQASQTQNQLREQFKATGAIIPDLENKIKRLKLALTGATSTREIALYNIRLKESQAELKRLQTLGIQTANATRAGFNQATISVNQFNTSLQRSSSSNGLLSGVKGQIGGLVASYASLYAIVAVTGRVISSNASLSDSLTDVRRTAELTEEETDQLLRTFKKLDNRTGLKGLADIAGIAGQMGIAKNEIAGFTATLDRLATVLSNEIKGGAEEVASALGKINGIFEVSAKEGITAGEAMSKTGSAILKLGQDGLATGEFLTDFTQRVAGVSKQADISLPTILAYGSVLEEAGVSAEVSATALNKFISSLATKRNTFFPVAQLADATLTIKEFTRLINTDADAAMRLFFEGASKGGVSFTKLSDILDEVGIREGRYRNAILALVQNQGKLTDKVSKSTEEFRKGTLEQEQYDLKNSNLAASVDKLSKSFENLTTSSNVQAFFKGIIDGTTDTITAFDRLVNSKSWREFFERMNAIQMDTFKKGTFKAFEDVVGLSETYKTVKDLNKELGSINLKNYNATNFNNDLIRAKDNLDKATQARKTFEEGVKTGALKERIGEIDKFTRASIDAGLIREERTINEFKILESQAQIHYQKRLKIESDFNKKSGIVKVKETDDDAEELTKKELAARESAAKKLESALQESANRIALAGKENRDRDLANLDIYYAKSFEIAKGNATALANLENNKGIERDAINDKWDNKEKEDREKVENEINSILERSLAGKIKTREQELAIAKAVYNEQVIKYKDSKDQLFKIDEAYNNEKDAINAKHDDKDFQRIVDFIAKTDRNRTQALIDQLELESKLKIAAAKGDEEAINAIIAEFAAKRKEITKQQSENDIIANNDGSILYTQIAQAKLQLEQLKQQFSNGLISQEAFDADRERLQGLIQGLEMVRGYGEQLGAGLGDAFASIIVDGEDAGKAIGKAFKSLASSIISDIIRIQTVKAIGNLFTGGLFGGLSGFLGFASGGYTGNAPRNQVAGVVHGQEMVINAEATSRNRALLESINSGRSISPSSVSTPVSSMNENRTEIFIPEQRTEGSTLITIFRRATKEEARIYG